MHNHFNVFYLQLRPFHSRKRRCSTDRVAYLPTVHFDLAYKPKDFVNVQIGDIFLVQKVAECRARASWPGLEGCTEELGHSRLDCSVEDFDAI